MAAQLRREGRTRAVARYVTGIAWVCVMLYVLISPRKCVTHHVACLHVPQML